MKRVLQIKSVGVYGGSGMGEYIGREAINQGWDSYMAYARNIQPTESKFIKIGGKIDILEHVLEARLFDNAGFASRRATKKMISRIEDIKPDIIHLHNLHGYFLNVDILFRYLKVSGIPVVWTIHDCWPITGHCSHFISVNCDKWKSQCNNCPLCGNYPKSYFIDRSSYNYVRKKELFTSIDNLYIVTVSKWLESILRQSFLKKKDIRTIYNGVDLNTFYPIKQDDKKDSFIIIGVAFNWGDHKGFSDYIALSKMLKDDEKIVLVGINDKMKSKLPSNIIPISRTKDQHELAKLYSKADVVTSLSYAETFGMSIVEGYACGTPVVAYNNTAQPELIGNSTGIVVEQGNIDQLYKAITEIRKKNDKEKIIMRNNCRKEAEIKYDSRNLYKQYINLYDQILKK